MVERTGSIEAEHGQPVYGKQNHQGKISHLSCLDQQRNGTNRCQNGAYAMGDGRPGTQAVIGIPNFPAAFGAGNGHWGGAGG